MRAGAGRQGGGLKCVRRERASEQTLTYLPGPWFSFGGASQVTIMLPSGEAAKNMDHPSFVECWVQAWVRTWGSNVSTAIGECTGMIWAKEYASALLNFGIRSNARYVPAGVWVAPGPSPPSPSLVSPILASSSSFYAYVGPRSMRYLISDPGWIRWLRCYRLRPRE